MSGSFKVSAPGASVVDQVKPEQIPSLEQRKGAVDACLGGLLSSLVVDNIAKYAMERFDDKFFGPEQWKSCWGVTPVTLPTLAELRLGLKLAQSGGRHLPKQIEEMSVEESANFLSLAGREEHVEPTEELYECLNRHVRPEDKCVAGFTCGVTYMPEFVRKDGRVFAVTARTLALEIGPKPAQGRVAKLADAPEAFNEIFVQEDADRQEPAHYFVMELDIAPDTRGKEATGLMKRISEQGDKGWQVPEPRNFIGTVFSQCAWKGLLYYHGVNTFTSAYCQGRARNGGFLSLGFFDGNGLWVFSTTSYPNACGASGSRKFKPLTLPANSC